MCDLAWRGVAWSACLLMTVTGYFTFLIFFQNDESSFIFCVVSKLVAKGG